MISGDVRPRSVITCSNGMISQAEVDHVFYNLGLTASVADGGVHKYNDMWIT